MIVNISMKGCFKRTLNKSPFYMAWLGFNKYDLHGFLYPVVLVCNQQ
jgi:hypothetical protein